MDLPRYLWINILNNLIESVLYPLKEIAISIVSLVSKEWRYDILPKIERYEILVDGMNAFQRLKKLKGRNGIDLAYVILNIEDHNNIYNDDEFKEFYKDIGTFIVRVPLKEVEIIKPSKQKLELDLYLSDPENDFQYLSKLLTTEIKESLCTLKLRHRSLSRSQDHQNINIRTLCDAISGSKIENFQLVHVNSISNLFYLDSLSTILPKIKEIKINTCSISDNSTLISLIQGSRLLEILSIIYLTLENFSENGYNGILQAVGNSKSIREFFISPDLPNVEINMNDIIKMINSNQSLLELTIRNFTPINPNKSEIIPITNTTIEDISIDGQKESILSFWEVPSNIKILNVTSALLNDRFLKTFKEFHKNITYLNYEARPLSKTNESILEIIKLNMPLLKSLNVLSVSTSESLVKEFNESLLKVLLSNTTIERIALEISIDCNDLCQLINHKSLKIIQVRGISNWNRRKITETLINANNNLKEIRFMNVEHNEEDESFDEYLESLGSIIENNKNLTFIQLYTPNVRKVESPSKDIYDRFKQIVKNNAPRLSTLNMYTHNKNFDKNFIFDSLISHF